MKFNNGTFISDSQVERNNSSYMKLSVIISSSITQIYTDKILEVGDISTGTKGDDSSTLSSCQVKLDDADGTLKQLFDTFPIENAPAALALCYSDTSYCNVISGHLTNPQWSEGDRVLTVTVESTLVSLEVGYSAEDGDYNDLDPDAIDVPWPLVFGKPLHVPAVRIRRQKTAKLLYTIQLRPKSNTVTWSPLIINLPSVLYNTDGKYIHPAQNCIVTTIKDDYTEEDNVIYFSDYDTMPAGNYTVEIDRVLFKGSFNISTGKFTVSTANISRIQGQTTVQDSGIVYDDKTLALGTYTTGTDQNYKDCFVYYGSNQYFENYCVRQDKDKLTFQYCFYKGSKIGDFSRGTPWQDAGDIGSIYDSRAVTKTGIVEPYLDTFAQLQAIGDNQGTQIATSTRYQGLNAFLTTLLSKGQSILWTRGPDVGVRIYGRDPDIYIANLVESEQVIAVCARKKGHRGQPEVLTQIPPDYYTVKTSYAITTAEGNSLTTTAILFNTPLANFVNEDWSDEIYVTLNSSLDNNPINAIKYILQTYTSLIIDADSFDTVASQQQYAAHFALTNRGNALQVAEQIAWQCKAALVIDSDIVNIVRVDLPPNENITLTLDNVEFKSIEESTTPRNEIITKLKAGWRSSYAPEDRKYCLKDRIRHKIIARGDIEDLGTIQKEVEVYIYNFVEAVIDLIDFWMSRTGSSWRFVTLKTYVEGVLLQGYDGVGLNIPLINVSLPSGEYIIGSARSVNYNDKDKSTTIKVWLPSYGGSTSFAFGAYL
jgi:hypothetical protein